MKNIQSKILMIIIGIIFSGILNGQIATDGVWKSTYELEKYTSDSLIGYTRIFLNINESEVTLYNFDRMLAEKQVFTSEGKIENDKNTLVFSADTENLKEYTFEINNQYLNLTLSLDPLKIIRFAKLKDYNLKDKKQDIEHFLIDNSIKGEFTYYQENPEIEFYADSSMIVTNSIQPYLVLLNQWVVVGVSNELFLHLSDFGPMVHITEFTSDKISFTDEYDQVYTGFFQPKESEVKFTKDLLLGIWEQETPDTTGLSAIPSIMHDKDFYMNEVWEFKNEMATKYYRFFNRETDWDLSRNGELLLLKSMEDKRFRILQLDDKILVVERINIKGEVYSDTFIRKNSVPKPKTLKKYL